MAKVRLQSVISTFSRDMKNEANDEEHDRAEDSRRNWIKKRLYAINYRNKRLGAPPLHEEQLQRAYARSHGRCELTGIKFSFSPYGGKRAPFAPSFDRIDASKPYTPSNIRVVCFAVNVALNQWGEDVFRSICTSYLGHFVA